MLKKTLECIEEFYNVKQTEQLFDVLHKIIHFNSGYIFFINPSLLRLEYSQNSILNKKEFVIGQNLGTELFQGIFSRNFKNFINKIGITKYLVSPLKVKNAVFGLILIEGEDFSQEEELAFNACAVIIANIIKDKEINNIISMQIKALHDGILTVKQSEEFKTDFLSHVTHEIRTPLNSILGYTQMLKDEFAGKLNDQQKDFTTNIQIAGIHLLEMINGILDLSKIEAKKIKLNSTSFNVRRIVDEVYNVILPLAVKKCIAIEKCVEDTQINADYQKLQQILFNLLSNAIKFTNEGGRIVISVTKSNKDIKISVKDNGIGIAEKDKSRIFEKFEQAASAKECSTGLGLAIIKEFVKLHGGKIQLNSQIGKGSEFIVILPNSIAAGTK